MDQAHLESLESLLKMFTFTKKRDLERYCRQVVITQEAFAALVCACDFSEMPLLHRIYYDDKQPPHLRLSEADRAALISNGVGELAPQAAKAVRKMSQMFEERRYVVGHMFFTPDLSKWHFFCFDLRDTDERKPHWQQGSHVHFINWLWPGRDAQSVWSDYMSGDLRPGSTLHMRFINREATGDPVIQDDAEGAAG